MVKQQQATFRAVRPMPPYWAARLDMPHPPAPGAFVLADCGGPVREVLFPSAVDATGLTALLPPGHPITQLLPGTPVDVLGPLGRGFRVAGATRLLLIAEVAHLPPLLPLLEAAPDVTLVLAAASRLQLPALDRFPPSVELVLVTDDGSAGYRGPLTPEDTAPSETQPLTSRLQELIAWADRVALGLARARYGALAAQVRRARLNPPADFAQALVRTRMPCGVGVCEICRVRVRHRERHVCVAGPVFDLLALDEARSSAARSSAARSSGGR
jgi:dihydroorotate dehydrogenase electron transfer subunit